MDYNELTLEQEILRCLVAHRRAVHPHNIKRWIEQDRLDRCLNNGCNPKPMQSQKRINNLMAEMDCVETVYIGTKAYRRLKKRGWMHKLVTTLTRVRKWLTRKQLIARFTVIELWDMQGKCKACKRKLSGFLKRLKI